MSQQPTDFWLDTYTIDQVFDTPTLIASLAQYTEQRAVSGNSGPKLHVPADQTVAQSILFLRIQAAASYHTTNRTLMLHPEPVDVDISTSKHRYCLSDTDVTSSRPISAEHPPTIARTIRSILHGGCNRCLVSLRLHLSLASLHRC
jgi:hypothetical protein